MDKKIYSAPITETWFFMIHLHVESRVIYFLGIGVIPIGDFQKNIEKSYLVVHDATQIQPADLKSTIKILGPELSFCLIPEFVWQFKDQPLIQICAQVRS